MDVHGHYQGLLDKFTKCALESSFTIQAPVLRLTQLHPPHPKWYELALVGGHLSLKTDIVPGNESGLAEALNIEYGELEILIYPLEQIRIDDPWNIKRSQVEVAYLYFDVNTDRTTLLLAFHFDFSVDEATQEPAAKHPLFHATLTHDLMQLGGLLQQRKVDTMRMQGMPEVRLPTAHMSLPSVLMSVAADHFSAAQFEIFLRSVREARPYPTMANDPFKKRMEKQKNRMRSCAWYADLPLVAAW
jgi:hypothetical protein